MSENLKQNNTRSGIAHIFFFCLVVFGVSHGPGFGIDVFANTTAKLSKKEKIQLVEQAVAAFEKGQRAKAKQLLKKAGSAFAENYAVPYYLGIIHLEEGNRGPAIMEWQRYVAMDSGSENALKIQKFITLLRYQQGRELARKTTGAGAKQPAPEVSGHTIVVPPFDNVGYEIFGPLGKGLASLLISDLSYVPDLSVVDRTRLEMMTKTEAGGITGGIQGKHSAKVGAMLNAAYVITGRLLKIKSDSLHIESTIFGAADNGVNKSIQTIEGELDQFYRLEKDLACNVVEKLGKNCEKMPEGFHKIHTQSLAALVAYAWGLDFLDAQDYARAREMFQKSLKEDPEFELAEKALMATPTPAMKNTPDSQLISSAIANGISSSAAGSAVIGSQKKGSGKTMWIAGGVALLGGGAALAGGGGGGGGGGDTGPGPEPEDQDDKTLSGVWYGTMSNGDKIKLDLQQSDTFVTGTMQSFEGECMISGDVNGTFSNGSFSIKVTSEGNAVTLNGKRDDAQITGAWNMQEVVAPCESVAGTFNGGKASLGSINW